MIKRIGAVAFVALIAALVIVPLAVGQNGHRHANGKNKFQLNGKVVSTDPATGTIVVTVKSGTRTLRGFRGTELTMTVAPNAKLLDATVDPTASTTLDAFVVDAKVHIGGTIDRTDPLNHVFTAKRLILQKRPVAPPTSPGPVVTP